MKKPVDALPYAIAVACGLGLVVVGAATKSDVSNDWLAFAGSILGSGLGALVGFWLIVTQEGRQAIDRNTKVREAMQVLDADVQRLIECGRANLPPDKDPVAAVETLRVDLSATKIVATHYGITNFSTFAALQDLISRAQTLDWTSMERNARVARTLTISYPDDTSPDSDYSAFTYVADKLAPAIQRVQQTLG